MDDAAGVALNMDKRIIHLRLIDRICYGIELAQLHRMQCMHRHSPVDDDAEQMVVAEVAEVVAMASGEFSVRDACAPAMGILAAKFSQLKLKWTMDIGHWTKIISIGLKRRRWHTSIENNIENHPSNSK